MRLNFQLNGDGAPLIILHGFLGSSDNWRATSRRMSTRFKVMSLDLRNHGRSPHHEAMSYPAMAEDIEEFYRGQNIASAYLLGHSMGGKVAMQFATTYPHRVEKLVVVDIAPKAYPASHEPMLAALWKLDLHSFSTFGEIDAALAPSIESAMMRQFLMKNLARQPDGSFCWRINLEGIIRNYHQLTKPIVPRHTFKHPVCFVRGGRSDYIQDEDLPLIKQIFPSAEIFTLPKAGHWIHIDAPDDFLNIVTGFLTGSPL